MRRVLWVAPVLGTIDGVVRLFISQKWGGASSFGGLAWVVITLTAHLVGAGLGIGFLIAAVRHRRWPPREVWALAAYLVLLFLVLDLPSSGGPGMGGAVTPMILGYAVMIAVPLSLGFLLALGLVAKSRTKGDGE